MDVSVSKETFLKQKISNLIIYLDKTVGKECNLYKQIIQISNNPVYLVEYSSQIVKNAYLDNDKYAFKDEVICDYIERCGLKKIDFIKLDDGKFLEKIKKYMEMFANVIGTS